MGQARGRWKKRERTDLGSAHRYRRRTGLLQLPDRGRTMRRLIAAMLLTLAVIAPACRTRKKGQRAEDDGKPLSVVKVADPRGSVQLIRGFHNVENDSWRWAMKNFTVSLRPPAGSATNGATLELKFTLPDAIFSQLGAMTIHARIAG